MSTAIHAEQEAAAIGLSDEWFMGSRSDRMMEVAQMRPAEFVGAWRQLQDLRCRLLGDNDPEALKNYEATEPVNELFRNQFVGRFLDQFDKGRIR